MSSQYLSMNLLYTCLLTPPVAAFDDSLVVPCKSWSVIVNCCSDWGITIRHPLIPAVGDRLGEGNNDDLDKVDESCKVDVAMGKEEAA